MHAKGHRPQASLNTQLRAIGRATARAQSMLADALPHLSFAVTTANSVDDPADAALHQCMRQ